MTFEQRRDFKNALLQLRQLEVCENDKQAFEQAFLTLESLLAEQDGDV